MAWSATFYVPYFRARSWKKAVAVIKSAEVKCREVVVRYSTVSYYYPAVEYEYEVKGTNYLGSRASFEIQNIWEEKDYLGRLHAEWLDWKEGFQLPVYYDKRNPTNAVLVRTLKPSRRSHHSAIFVSGLLCVGLGVFMVRLYV